MLDFIEFTFLDVLDILLVAILLYYIYKLLKGTVAINIFIGIAFIFLIWKITQALKMEMLSGILGYLLSGGVIALIIVFQQEIRKFLLMIGTTNFTNKRSFLKQLKFLQTEIGSEMNTEVILEACKNLSKTKTGALIVIAKNSKGSVNAIQAIFLDEDGRKLKGKSEITGADLLSKQTFGIAKSMPASIGASGKKEGVTFVAEGIETALSVLEAIGEGDVKVTFGKSNLG